MTDSDLSVIESDGIRDALCQIVEKHLKTKNYKINVSSASQVGETNFVGIVYRVSYCKRGEDVNGPNASKLILKVAPTHPSRREKLSVRLPFMREIYMYDVALTYFRRFEESKGVTVGENGFFEYPECYQTVDVDLSECLFLEDMKQRSFRIVDKAKEQLTAEHVNLVMHALGKFHAISFALRDQQPEKFEELTLNLKEQFLHNADDTIKRYFNKQALAALDAVSSDEDIRLHTKLKKILEKDVIDSMLDTMNLDNIGSGVVLSHGDAWQNNILWASDENEKATECCILDWQNSHCASPIHDLVYFIFCCTTKELRDIHHDNFLRNYHESLSAHLRRLGSDPDKLFPFDLMQEHFRKFARYGLLVATDLLTLITADSGNAMNMDEMFDEVNKGGEIDASAFTSETSRDKFHKRMRDVFVDMDRLNYI